MAELDFVNAHPELQNAGEVYQAVLKDLRTTLDRTIKEMKGTVLIENDELLGVVQASLRIVIEAVRDRDPDVNYMRVQKAIHSLIIAMNSLERRYERDAIRRHAMPKVDDGISASEKVRLLLAEQKAKKRDRRK